MENFTRAFGDIHRQQSSSTLSTSFNYLFSQDIPQLFASIGTTTTVIDAIKYTFTISDVRAENISPTVRQCFQYSLSLATALTCTLELKCVALGAPDEKETILSTVRTLLCKVPTPTGTNILSCGPFSDADDEMPAGIFLVNGKLRTIPSTKCTMRNLMLLQKRKSIFRLQVRSLHEMKPFRSTSSIEFVISEIVKKSASEGLISVNLPFCKLSIHIGILAFALNCTPPRFIALIRAIAGKDFEKPIFRRYELSLLFHKSMLTVNSSEDAVMAISKAFGKSTPNAGRNLLRTELFPHLNLTFGDINDPRIPGLKLFYLAKCIVQLILFRHGKIPETNRDFLVNSFICPAAEYIGQLVRLLLIQHIRTVSKLLRRALMKTNRRTAGEQGYLDLVRLIGETRLSSRILSAVSNGSWSTLRKGMSLSLNSNNHDAVVGQLRRISSSISTTDGVHTEPREVQDDQYGYICPASTPDGELVGLVVELASTAVLTLQNNHLTLRNLLQTFFSDLLVPVDRVINEDDEEPMVVPAENDNLDAEDIGEVQISRQALNNLAIISEFETEEDADDDADDDAEEEGTVEGKETLETLKEDEDEGDEEEEEEEDPGAAKVLVPDEEEEDEDEEDEDEEQEQYVEVDEPKMKKNKKEAKVKVTSKRKRSNSAVFAPSWLHSRDKVEEYRFKVVELDMYTFIDSYGAMTDMIRADNVDELVQRFLQARRNGDLPVMCFIEVNRLYRHVRIFCEVGLIARPLIVQKNAHLATPTMTLVEMLNRGIVEYVNPNEEQSVCVVSERWSDRDKPGVTHIEFKASIFGQLATTVPFATSQQGPRLSYLCHQKKQMITSGLKERWGAIQTTELWHAHRSLVTTETALIMPDMTHNRSTPLVFALLALPGNQEDAIILKKSTVERLGMASSTTRHYVSDCATPTNVFTEKFCKPHDVLSKKELNYEGIQSNGLPKVGTFIEGGGIVIGKTRTIRRASGGSSSRQKTIVTERDISTCSRPDEAGNVTAVSLVQTPSGQRAIVSVASTRLPCVGDKFSTDHSQKGTVSEITADEDLPFSMTTGMIPDCICSPLGMTSRMTMGSLLTMITGKAVAVTGDLDVGVDKQDYDKSNKEKADEIGKLLVDHGFARNGTEIFIDGRTGEPLTCRVFVGVLPVYRLIHLSKKKLHARSIGKRDVLTRQATNGRREGGGLRAGELEGAAIASFGCAALLQERYSTLSDGTTVYVCEQCSLLCDGNLEADYIFCRACQSSKYAYPVRLPHTFILCLYELLSTGVLIKLYLKDDPSCLQIPHKPVIRKASFFTVRPQGGDLSDDEEFAAGDVDALAGQDAMDLDEEDVW